MAAVGAIINLVGPILKPPVLLPKPPDTIEERSGASLLQPGSVENGESNEEEEDNDDDENDDDYCNNKSDNVQFKRKIKKYPKNQMIIEDLDIEEEINNSNHTENKSHQLLQAIQNKRYDEFKVLLSDAVAIGAIRSCLFDTDST